MISVTLAICLLVGCSGESNINQGRSLFEFGFAEWGLAAPLAGAASRTSSGYQTGSSHEVGPSYMHPTEVQRDVLSKERTQTVCSAKRLNDDSILCYAVSDNRTFGTTGTGEHVDFEALLGIKITTKGSQLSVKAYANNDKNVPKDGITILRIDVEDSKTSQKSKLVIAESFSLNKVVSYDCAKLANGIYRVDAEFDKITTYGYVTKDATGIHTCRTCFSKSDKELQEKFDKAFAKIKPEDNLSIKNLSYPSTHREYYNAADDLCKLTDTIVKDEWSDELKTYAIFEYMNRHWAYDGWYANQGYGKHYNRFGGTWTDPRAFLPESKVGCCTDFANSAVIMLRYLGIPACGLDSESANHMWCAAYLNGEWVSFDGSNLVAHTCNDEDTDPSQWKKHGCDFDSYYGNKQFTDDMVINSKELRTYSN